MMSGLVNPARSYKVVVLNELATFDATHTTFSQVTNAGAYEVYGNGWPQGGKTLTNVEAVATGVDNRDAKLVADGVLQLISGGQLGQMGAYLVYDTADNAAVAYVELASGGTIPADTYFSIDWPDSGIQYLAKQS